MDMLAGATCTEVMVGEAELLPLPVLHPVSASRNVNAQQSAVFIRILQWLRAERDRRPCETPQSDAMDFVWRKVAFWNAQRYVSNLFAVMCFIPGECRTPVEGAVRYPAY